MKARTAVSVVLAAALMLGTAGCSFFAPIATVKPYDPSDGIGANIGDVKVRNALLVMDAGDTDASLVVSLLNASDEDIELTIQYNSGAEQVNKFIDLPANSIGKFGGSDDEQIVLEGIDTRPGALFPVWFQYSLKTGKELLVPVLDGSLAEYSDLLPTTTPTPVPSPSPSATFVPTPSLTANPAPSPSPR